MPLDEPRPWHHLFGLSWIDFFHGTGVVVEPEKDLSHHQQFLDLVFLRNEDAVLPARLPDGFEDLCRYNLVTFKSHQEALTSWALNELVTHYVNLRKQVGPNLPAMLPETDFRRIAVCVRSPHNLIQLAGLQWIQPGVQEASHFADRLRVVVVNELPREEHNAVLLLFSARQDLVEYAAQHYQPHSAQTSTLLLQLIHRYHQEAIPMPETLEQFAQRITDELFQQLPQEKRLELLQALPPEERRELLQALPPDERLEGLSPEERVQGLSLEELETLAQRLRENAGQPPKN